MEVWITFDHAHNLYISLSDSKGQKKSIFQGFLFQTSEMIKKLENIF